MNLVFLPRALLGLAILWSTLPGWTYGNHPSSPQLSIILPRGVQRGMQHELTFSGARLDDAQEVFLYDSGVTVVKIEPIDANNIKVTVDVAADCRLGEHVAQVRTKSGITEYRSFFVGALPVVDEVEPNSGFDQPQRIQLNHTINGVVTNEDIDWYVVTVTKGQRLTAEVEAIRLAAMFDPFVGIVDAKRFELAACDDSALLRQDSLVSLLAPEDGDYYVYVREASFGGNDSCRYRLHVGTFPRPTVVYPAGGPPGQELDLKFLGDPAGEISRKLAVDFSGKFRPGLFVEDEQGITPSPVAFRNFPHPNSLESEPNEDMTALGSATALPAAFNGVIGTQGDRDHFKFTSKKDEVWDIEVYSRRIGSGLDPVLVVYNAERQPIANNDDARGPDAYLRFQAPADGDFYLGVLDHLRRGQSDFVYRIEIDHPAPTLAVEIPRSVQYSQERQTIVVPQGNRFATLISATRENFGGDLALGENQLPDGVKIDARPMPANLTVMPVVFEADEQAPLAGKLIDFTARPVDAAIPIVGHFRNLADFVLGEPNNSLYYGCTIDRVATAVVDKVPFKLQIEPPTAPLIRNGSIQIKVIATRAEGFNGPINVQFPFRPPGVGTTGSINIPEGQTEGYYPLNADGNAQIGKWPIFVLGSADVNGPAWVSSQLAEIEIAQPFVTFEITRTACDQGQPAQLYCKLNQLAPFEGEAKAELLGLPAEVTAEPKTITKDTTELVFDVKTTANSPAGTHKTMFAQVTVMRANQASVGNAGGTEFQINIPIVKTDAPAPAAEPAPPAEPQAKPLSRLEQLRQAKSGGGQDPLP
jgi:hypothetical protein